ncbi:MAG: flagellar export protein FliJ [Spirochaetaceae bacterium]|jgi:flagellar FliJ protein|nr:flagellar export protein FliJ [Spirochaetaceae bacterium]
MAKKFTFSLDKVLNIRSWDEETARLELGRAVSALSLIEQNLAKNNDARRLAKPSDFETPSPQDAASTNAMIALNNYIQRLDAEKERLLSELEAAQKVVDEKSELWREAAAQKKTLENLKDRRHAKYKKDALREEEKELDDTKYGGADSL